MKDRLMATLSITPVTRYRVPRYPTSEDVSAQPFLLAHIPARWQGKPAVCAALFVTLSLGLSGCAQQQIPVVQVSAVPNSDGQPLNSPKPRQALNIPVFSHGEGRGSYGCVSVAPPVFLSEEEAAQVIREEARQYGIEFESNKTAKSNRLPYTSLYDSGTGQNTENKTHSGSIDLDGFDEKTGIGYEFISTSDVSQWQDPSSKWASSVETYDAKGTADRLAGVLNDTVVFYDPMSAKYEEFDFSFNWEVPGKTQEELDAEYRLAYEAASTKYKEEQHAKSEENLRAQVRDFLDWLKAQGVI